MGGKLRILVSGVGLKAFPLITDTFTAFVSNMRAISFASCQLGSYCVSDVFLTREEDLAPAQLSGCNV